MLIKIISFLLIAVMLTGFVSCSETTEVVPADTTARVTDSDTAIDLFKANVPDSDFNQEEITFLVSSETMWGYDIMDSEEQNGESVNDAFYIRNRQVEEKLGILINQMSEPYSSFRSNVRKVINANDTVYDVVMPRLYYGVQMAQEGLFLNVNNIPYIDLSQLWWDSAVKRDLSFDDKLYMLAGDIHMYSYDATWILFFNKGLQADLNVGDLYGHVLNKTWTLETFNKILVDVTSDLTGDSIITWEDRFGFITQDISTVALLNGASQPIFERDSESAIKVNVGSDSFVDVFEKVSKIMYSDQTMNISNTTKWKLPAAAMIGNVTQQIFAENRSLFVAEVVDCVSRYKDMDTDFGVLPFPMLDEKQDEYLSTVIHDAMVLSVPLTCADTEMIGIILESLAAESRKTVLPAYYNVTLQRKRARDDESAEMLDIIFSQRYYSLDLIYNWGSVKDALVSLLNKGSTDVASTYAKTESKIQTAIDNTIEAYGALD